MILLTSGPIIKSLSQNIANCQSPHSRSLRHRSLNGRCYLFTVSSSSLLFFSYITGTGFPNCTFTFSCKRTSSCVIFLNFDLIYELDLDTFRYSSHLGQKSFRSNVIVRTHTHTQSGPTALAGPQNV